MARGKNGIKSGIGIAARVVTKLVEAVEDNGGTDEVLRRIEHDPFIRERVAKVLMGPTVVREYVGVVDNEDPRWRTIDRGLYALVGEVTAFDFDPIGGEGRVTRRFLEFRLPYGIVSDVEIADAMKELGCRYPTRPEAEYALRLFAPDRTDGRRVALMASTMSKGRLGDVQRGYLWSKEGQCTIGLASVLTKAWMASDLFIGVVE